MSTRDAAAVPNQVPNEIAREIDEHSTFFRVSGIAAIVTGALAIVMPHLATFAAGLTIGLLFLVNGVIGTVTAFRARRGGRILAGFLIGLLAIVAGGVLLLQPFAGIVALTLFLAAYLIASGALRGWFAWSLRPADGWKLVAAGGALSIALGLLITFGLPGNAVWVLGLIVGVDLLFSGVALLATVSAVRASGSDASTAEVGGSDHRDATTRPAWQS